MAVCPGREGWIFGDNGQPATLGILLTKDVQDVYAEYHKVLLEDIKEHPSKWNNIHVVGKEYSTS